MTFITRSVVISGDTTTFFPECFSCQRTRVETESNFVSANPRWCCVFLPVIQLTPQRGVEPDLSAGSTDQSCKNPAWDLALLYAEGKIPRVCSPRRFFQQSDYFELNASMWKHPSAGSNSWGIVPSVMCVIALGLKLYMLLIMAHQRVRQYFQAWFLFLGAQCFNFSLAFLTKKNIGASSKIEHPDSSAQNLKPGY